MTQQDFLSFYPQFSSFPPAVVLSEYIAQANGRFSAFDGPDAEEARRLYVAHKLTLYAFTVPASGGSAPDSAAIAAAGRAESARQVSSRKVGEVSVSYASGSAMAANVTTGLADLAETAYGLQLLTLLRMYSRSVYVP